MTSLNNVKDAGSGPAVLIVGAGPTGLTLAVDLARRGVPALLVERADGLFPGSRGKGLQPRTLEVFDDLGVIDRVLAAGGPYPRVMTWEDDRQLGEHDMAVRSPGPVPGVPYPEGVMLPQWRTQRVLYEGLRELGGDVLFGTALTELAQDESGVTARLGNGESVRSRWLVAADGGRSTVRGLLGIGMTGETVATEPMLVADARVEGLSREHWHMWPKAPGGGIALCPLAGTDQFQISAKLGENGHPGGPGGPGTGLADVRRLVAERTPLDASAVRDLSWASTFVARAALADRFRDGRVLLAGDAAHIHSPMGGQGLNTSVQDAYNLGWKLAAALADPGTEEALLDSYERERVEVAADVLGLSTRLHRAADAGREEGRRRGREVLQLDLGYRTGPLSRDTRGTPDGTLRAGDRAPDAECALPDGTPLRLFDAFRGPHCTLLAVGGAPADGAVPAVPLPVRTYAVTMTEPHAREAYGTRPALFLIRPDGYVGLATEDPAEVAGYTLRP
ncbi:pentachlorophenol monooxygenase [Streptomyces armeniacus]|uniref:Pentachlorophenol monooxygenase n=1 Tax=Streptomyces armeniacus TaxID=83291 RepID=A0A345XVR2_9ACTN|nr:FAD-dependent monooxygenase [Streptomyces armeniacus]AXK35728.1 pentachlorophenol monooxygenase [Streptomyces armeniacus]